MENGTDVALVVIIFFSFILFYFVNESSVMAIEGWRCEIGRLIGNGERKDGNVR